MNNTFDFQEALSYIKAGMSVSLTINDTERVYRLNDKGEITCTPNKKEHLTYTISSFMIDAVMSNNWVLVNAPEI